MQSAYIGGAWTELTGAAQFALINPATEEKIGNIALATAIDVEKAVSAARKAFAVYSRSSVGERIDLLQRIAAVYEKRRDELASLLTLEMGAPISRTRLYQTSIGLTHLLEAINVLRDYPFETRRPNGTLILREPIGVCGLITPWNAPIMQVVSKVAPALAAGCTMILKPSEQAPLSAILFTEILHEAGVPAGVFNLLNGTGVEVGEAISRHADIDMVSFTGSTRAGINVAKTAAQTVKRVHQELGGKSANILLDDADFDIAVTKGVMNCYGNSGQSCIAPDRMLVPAKFYDRTIEIAADVAEKICVGNPFDERTNLGPLVNKSQYDRVRDLIEQGKRAGARLVTGGTERPEGLEHGYFVRPTVFADVTADNPIAMEEIFGPVISIIPYQSEDEAIEIANNTPYGLAAYVQSTNPERIQAVARRLQAGYVYANYALPDYSAPFGGYKQSGNGREYGEWGIEAFMELKSVVGT